MKKVLLEICENLKTYEVEEMSYLLSWSGIISRSQQEKYKYDSRELFKILYKQCKLGNENATILQDILNLIKKEACSKLEKYFGGNVPGNDRLTGYIVSLYKFVNELTTENLTDFKYLLNIPSRVEERIENFWQLFDYCLGIGKVQNTPDSLLDFIYQLDENCVPLLEKKFNENHVVFKKRGQATTGNPGMASNYQINTSAQATLGNPGMASNYPFIASAQATTGNPGMASNYPIIASAQTTIGNPGMASNYPTIASAQTTTGNPGMASNYPTIASTQTTIGNPWMAHNPQHTGQVDHNDSISHPMRNLDIAEPGMNQQENYYQQQAERLLDTGEFDQPLSEPYHEQSLPHVGNREGTGDTEMKNEETLIFPLVRLHDKALTLTNMMSYMSNEEIGSGLCGTVYKGKKKFKDCVVAIKELKYNGETYDSLIKEKTVAKLVHPHIVPVFATWVSQNRSHMYIMYPYMEGGDLHKAIGKTGDEKLEWKKRVTISYQISQALQFLHKEILIWKKVFNHCDVKLSNILLDKNGNARLSDMGLAKENPNSKTTWMSTRRDEAKVRNLTDFDVYCLGIVMLELLLNQIHDETNFNIKDFRGNEVAIQSEACKVIWSTTDVSVIEQFAKSIKDALGTPNNSEEHISSEQLGQDLHEILKCCSDQKFLIGEEKSNKCFACMINKAAALEPVNCSKKTGGGRQYPSCEPFCTKCHKISYRNPLYCPKHGACSPKIGYNTFALIVAGNDVDNAVTANVFYSGAKAMEKMMKSRHPVIMGIEDEYVLTSLPPEPGKPCEMKTDVLDKLDRIKGLVEGKKSKGESTRFIFIYTGDGSEGQLNLGDCVKDILKAGELGGKISEIHCDMLLILDCCYAGTIKFELPSSDRSVIQWSSCDKKQQQITENCVEKGTIFMRCVLNLLRGELYSDYNVCERRKAVDFDKCQLCKTFKLKCAEKNNIITFQALHDYVEEHRKEYGNFESCLTGKIIDFPLAYYTDKDEDLMFRIDGRDPCKILNLCPVIHIDDIKSRLLNEFKEPADRDKDLVQVCVKVTNHEDSRIEIQNLSEFSIHRDDLDLEVTLRQDPKYILEGPVVLFLQGNPEDTETVIEHMGIFDHQDARIWVKGFDYKTIITGFKTPLDKFKETSELVKRLKRHFEGIQKKLNEKLNRVDNKHERNRCNVTVKIRDSYVLTEVQCTGF